MGGATSLLSLWEATNDPVVQGNILPSVSAGEDSISSGMLVYLERSTGNWNIADAAAVGTSTPLLGIALNTADENEELSVLLNGLYTTEYANVNDNGQPCWVSTTAGYVDGTAPTSSGEVVRGIGWCLNISGDFKTIVFQPDVTWIEL
jgi:hypothetical protein